MPMPVRFVPNPVGIAAAAVSAEMAAELKEKAEAVTEAAQSLAHAEAYETGAYAASIVVESSVVDGKAAARVHARDFKSAFLVARRGCETSARRCRGLGVHSPKYIGVIPSPKAAGPKVPCWR